MASSCKKGYYYCNTSQKCKRIPKGYKVQSDGYLVREYVSDWRSDIQEVAPSSQNLSTLKDRKDVQRKIDNLPTFIPKTTTNTNNGNTSISVSAVNRREATANAINKMPKIGGVKVQMDADGNVPNAGDFAAKASTRELNKPFVSKVGNAALGKNNFNQVKKYASGGELERDVNSSVPGSQQFRLNIAGDEVNQATQKYKKPNRRINSMDNIRVKEESLYDWRSTLTEETDCDCEGCGQDPCVKCGKSHHNINEEIQGGVSVENYADGVQFNEIETVDIIKPKSLDPSDWRSEMQILEGNRTRYKGYSLSGSGNKKDMSKGPNEKVYVDYTQIQAKADKKKEVVAASHEVEGDLVDEGLLKGALSGAKIIAKVAPKVTKGIIKGGKALARKGAGDISKFKKSQEMVRRLNNIDRIRTNKLLQPIKPTEVKWNPTVPSKIKPKVSTFSTKQITGSAGKDYKKAIGPNPTAKTQYNEPITPKYTRSQKSALTGKAQKVIDQIRGKTPGAKLSAKIEKAYDKNLQKTGDKIIKDIKATPIPKEKAIVKNPGGKMTPSPSGSLVKTTDKGSAIVKNSGGKLTKDVPSNNRKLSAKEKLAKAGSGTKGSGTTYAGTSKPPLRLPQGGPDEDKVRAAVAGASFGLGGYAGTKVFGKKEKNKVNEAAMAIPIGIGLGKTAVKLGGAVLASKGGEEILKRLLRGKKRQDYDWEKNPKDDIDKELNTKQRQAKDKAKNKEFDKQMDAYRKAKNADNLSSKQRKEILGKNAKIKKDIETKKESFSDWRSEINL